MGYKQMRIDGFEPEKYERELEALAADGMAATWYNNGTVYYEESGPQNVRYAIEAGRTDRKKREAYAELGWRMISDKSGVTIFRNDDPNAPSLRTDPEEHARTLLGYYRQNALKLLLVYAVCALLPFALLTYWYLKENKLFYYMTDPVGAPFKSMAELSVSALIVCIFFTAVTFRSFGKAGKAAAAASEDRKKAARIVLSGILLRIAAFVVCVILAGSAAVLALTAKKAEDSERTEITQSELPGYVLTADELLDGIDHSFSGSWQEYNDHYLSWGDFYYDMHFTGYGDGHAVPNTAAVFSKTGFTESCYEFEQYLTSPTEPHIVPPVDDSLRLKYAAKCCEFRSETSAKLYLNERLKNMSSIAREKAYPDMPCAGIDEFRYMYTYLRDYDRGDLNDYIFVRCGSTVYELCFTYDARSDDSENLLDAAVNNIRRPVFRS